MLQQESAYRRHLGGSITIWMVIILPIFLGLFAFALDFGMVFYEKSREQTAADAAALAGADVLKRVFKIKTTDMSPLCKAGHVGAAVMEVATAAEIAPADVELVYCPRSSEVNGIIANGGPCFALPTNASCDADCDCGGLAGAITSVAKPWQGLYPLAVEMAGSGTAEEDTTAYVYVGLSRRAAVFFTPILSAWTWPEVTARAIAMAKKEPLPLGPGFFQPLKEGNDPQTINIKNGSSFVLNNGGILMMDDPRNALTSSGAGNSVTADWIKAVTDEDPSSITFSCRLFPDGPCPEYNVDADDYEAEAPVFTARNCSTLTITDKNEKCTRNETLRIYANCTIDASNVGVVHLYPGTYCGGLTIDGVDVHLAPLVASGDVVDDVYFFVERGRQPGDVAGTPLTTPGKLLIENDSTVEGVNGGVLDAGVYLYAPEVSGSDFGIDILSESALTGYIHIWSDHLRLDDSSLDYTAYGGGKNKLNPLTIMTFNLVQ